MNAPVNPNYSAVRPLPMPLRLGMLLRLFAVQGSWNYETLLGNGIAFAMEPALRGLPGGRGGDAYRAAMARESRYFNAHPYLASFAVGALARAELDGVPPAQIDRFRAAMCGPLGSIGDRLIWAGWLPCVAMLSLLAFGAGANGVMVAVLFLVTYNAGHIVLRAWGLNAGWRQGLQVAAALGRPILRDLPQRLAGATVVIAGAALPLAVRRLIGDSGATVPGAAGTLAATALVIAAVLGLALVRLHGRVEGWKVAFGVLLLVVIYSGLR